MTHSLVHLADDVLVLLAAGILALTCEGAAALSQSCKHLERLMRQPLAAAREHALQEVSNALGTSAQHLVHSESLLPTLSSVSATPAD
mmetsp:Transcript_53656/g.89093  ORF Transcript_53656/g.89093 Transcript_53656/m.89093 type:complete len:88 (+) Transcript_53656:115-378(+)